MIRSLLLATILTGLPLAVTAQGSIDGAVSAYETISGRWATPGATCSSPIGTWRFGTQQVTGGGRMFRLRGIGGNSQRIILDLIDMSTGAQSPVALTGDGAGGLRLSGSGLSATLSRCAPGSLSLEPRPGPTTPPGTITSRPLDAPVDEGGATATDDEDVEETSRMTFANNLRGQWRQAGGTCVGGWRLSESAILVEGSRYEVIRFVGQGDRIGVNAVGPDGAPVTFSFRDAPTGLDATMSTSAGPAERAALTRC